jgi:hypothetical protein
MQCNPSQSGTRDSYPWGTSARQQLAHVVAKAAALAIAAWVKLPLPGKPSGRIVRHGDGLLAIHVWQREEPIWSLEAWHEGTPLDPEQAIKAYVAGYLVEVYYTDRKSAAKEVLRIAARR